MNHKQAISKSLNAAVVGKAEPPPPADFHTAFPKLLPSRRGYSKIARFAPKFARSVHWILMLAGLFMFWTFRWFRDGGG